MVAVSQVLPHKVACPSCRREQGANLYESIQAHLLRHEREAILEGTFEARRCEGCGQVFQPEHRALYVDTPAQLWVLMVPPSERRKVRQWERDLAAQLSGEFARLPEVTRLAMPSPKVRLVLGQAALTEAVFCVREGIEPETLECAKMLWWQRMLGLLLELGPCALRVRGRGARDGLVCRADDLEGRPLREGLELESQLVDEARERAARWRESNPGLFGRPWCCASGELFPP